MSLNEIEKTLRGMIEAEQARGRPTAEPARRRWFSRSRPLVPAAAPSRPDVIAPKAAPPNRIRRFLRERRGDLVMTGLGVALAAGCASFPWYIFFNQDKFGVRAMTFAGNRAQQQGPISMGSKERVGAPMSVEEIPPMQLDLFATATVSSQDEDSKGATPKILDQAFPGDEVSFRLLYASAGRAMIADDTGMWVVERGSLLPDNSRVTGIEQRDGRWVLLTSRDGVIPISAN